MKNNLLVFFDGAKVRIFVINAYCLCIDYFFI